MREAAAKAAVYKLLGAVAIPAIFTMSGKILGCIAFWPMGVSLDKKIGVGTFINSREG